MITLPDERRDEWLRSLDELLWAGLITPEEYDSFRTPYLVPDDA
ncbi:MAG: hypothetical protein ACLFO2_05425 [Candidatus Woesearchaeota archaeon]